MLALEWCRRSQHFYNLYRQSDRPDFRYSPQELTSYEESAEWVAFLASSGCVGAVRDRTVAIRSLQPERTQLSWKSQAVRTPACEQEGVAKTLLETAALSSCP